MSMDINDIYKYAVRRMEKLVLVFPTDRRNEVLDALYDAGFALTRTGPRMKENEFPKVDPTRQEVHAEREVET